MSTREDLLKIRAAMPESVEMDDEIQEITRLKGAGHPEHCAIRQVWGDGECECDLYKRGYDPDAWKMETVDVKTIVKNYLIRNGYHGLYCDDCGCENSDLMCCDGEGIENCQAGYKMACDPDTCQGDGDCDWHIGPREEAKP